MKLCSWCCYWRLTCATVACDWFNTSEDCEDGLRHGSFAEGSVKGPVFKKGDNYVRCKPFEQRTCHAWQLSHECFKTRPTRSETTCWMATVQTDTVRCSWKQLTLTLPHLSSELKIPAVQRRRDFQNDSNTVRVSGLHSLRISLTQMQNSRPISRWNYNVYLLYTLFIRWQRWAREASLYRNRRVSSPVQFSRRYAHSYKIRPVSD